MKRYQTWALALGLGALALAGNGVCFVLLWRHRAEDINMRSVWLCSRNDLIGNCAVLASAIGVARTGARRPNFRASA
mgnify:CR=1 FL=1